MSDNSNSINVPEARQAMEQFKMECANEVGVNLKQGYNGDLTSRQAGSVGGQMVKKMMPKHRTGNNFYTPEDRKNISSIFLFKMVSNLRKPLVNHPPQIINYIIHIAL